MKKIFETAASLMMLTAVSGCGNSIRPSGDVNPAIGPYKAAALCTTESLQKVPPYMVPVAVPSSSFSTGGCSRHGCSEFSSSTAPSEALVDLNEDERKVFFQACLEDKGYHEGRTLLGVTVPGALTLPHHIGSQPTVPQQGTLPPPPPGVQP